jgi:glycosyltransferase involved in cell wall biosynthesis
VPKVSVIIPAYNAMTYLPTTLESVLQQTLTDFEVLIINDGSSDSIVQWASQLADSRVRLISQENRGVSCARNTGITEAKGEYIAFIDADDLWESTKLEKQVHCLETQPDVGLVYTWTLLVDEHGQPLNRVYASDVEGDVWQQLVENDMIANGSNIMVRHQCFETVGLFDRNLTAAEDYDMCLRIATSYPFGVVKEPLTLYRQHPNSVSKARQKLVDDLRVVLEKTFQSAPLELLYLRNRAYASIFLGLAWLAIDEGNYEKALQFRQQVLLHHAQLFFSKKIIHLSFAIAMIRWFGSNSFNNFRSAARSLRQRLLELYPNPS